MVALRAVVTGGLLTALSLLLAGCTAVDFEAMRVLEDLAAGGRASALKEATPPPQRITISYRIDDTLRSGDLYEPGGRSPARAGIVLVPGVAAAGKDDRRLVALANTLARARFAVHVPDLPNLRELKVGASDAEPIADAAALMLERSGRAGYRSVGIAAISYAAGPAIMAALRPDIRDRIAFVATIGGYYDVVSVVTFFTTGMHRVESSGPWRHLEPNAYGKWIFVLSNADRMEMARDRVALRAMARRRMRDPKAGIGDLVDDLSGDGRAVHALLVNRDPVLVPGLIAALPGGVRADLAALDLKTKPLDQLAARLLLVHGRDDTIIPFSESVRLAAAVGPGRAAVFLPDSLQHAELGPLGVIDYVILWRAVRSLLGFRDDGPAGW